MSSRVTFGLSINRRYLEEMHPRRIGYVEIPLKSRRIRKETLGVRESENAVLLPACRSFTTVVYTVQCS